MPGAQERVLRRRIGSIQNTKKITRAMELIAATRVVKAQQAAQAARPYSERITHVIRDLSAAGASVDHPLLAQAPEVNKVGIVVLSSDRGLAGAYNSSVIRAAEKEIMAARSAGRQYALVTVGRKAEGYFRFRNYPIEAAFSGFTEKPTFDDAKAIADKITELFEGDADVITLCYTRFISMGSQKVAVRRFLPLETHEPEDEQHERTLSFGIPTDDVPKGPVAGFEFEPSASSVVAELLPRYVESRVFAALLDAAASELSSRQRAMKSATDNAQELIVKYTRKMNQARQDAITTEIMEIIGGAEALSASGGSEELLLHHLDGDPFGSLTRPRQFADTPER